jgi:hypothetical protein
MSVSPDAPKAPRKRRRSTKKLTATSETGQDEEGEHALLYTSFSFYLLIFRTTIGTTHGSSPRNLRKSSQVSSLFTLNSSGTVLRGKVAISRREIPPDAPTVIF